jgi:hypothetical protein
MLLKIINRISYSFVSNSCKSLQDKYKGQTCYIVGNGPSLNNMDLSLLDDKFVFGLNKIHLINKTNPLKVDIMVCVNEFVIQQSYDQIIKNAPKTFLKWNWKFLFKKRIKNVDYLNSDLSFTRFSNDITKNISEGYTVTFVAMQIAFYLGFKNIILIGVDHNFSQEGNANEVQSLNHDDVNHFSKDYFKGNKWQLADLFNSELSYTIAKFYFEKHNRTILNAGINSKLNIFQKVDFESVIKNNEF